MTWQPSEELLAFYRDYHQGKLPPAQSSPPKPEDFDFPASTAFRDYYAEQYGGDIDFPCSPTFRRYYESKGAIPSSAGQISPLPPRPHTPRRPPAPEPSALPPTTLSGVLKVR